MADQLAQQLSGILTLLNLVTGFLALGLIVGIAGLGVISTRAVVERWQQIGMLRALGFRRSLVQGSFLMESSLIAILGLIIGAIVGCGSRIDSSPLTRRLARASSSMCP